MTGGKNAARTTPTLKTFLRSRTSSTTLLHQPSITLVTASSTNHAVVAAALVVAVGAPDDDVIVVPRRRTRAGVVVARVDRVGRQRRLGPDAHPLALAGGALVRVARLHRQLDREAAGDPGAARRGRPADGEGLGLLVADGALRGLAAVEGALGLVLVGA